MSLNISSSTLQSWRERPPSSYSIKVKILSKFQTSTLSSDGKYQSRLFSSGRYKWRMIIYPNGNDNDDGKGYLSMYVEIDNISLISAQTDEVYADIRFFVFNKIENKYFTIQDVESKPFNTLRTRWGLPKVLALDTFSNHKSGYLFDGDLCEFGVDIVVTPPPTKWEFVFLIKENPHESNSFSIGGRKWLLKLYPKGYSAYSAPDDKWVSIFLFPDVGEILKEDDKIYVQANLKVEDPRGSNHLTRNMNGWYQLAGTGRGYDHFVSLLNLRNSYLDDEDTLKLEIEFKVVSTTKYSSSQL
ncbi:hypothetical protein Bca4012_019111 [Brassica carinata]